MRKKLSQFILNHRKVFTFSAVVFILVFMFLVSYFSSRGAFGDPGDSGIVDEIAHIPAGYTYIKDQDFRLNPEHPPLAKAISGVSLVIGSFNGPEASWAWNGINQWESGWGMIYRANDNPEALFIWARLPMILLMIGLGLFLFKWARELFGTKIGLIVLTLYAFYPDVIAHGRLVTTDIAAAFGFVIATYYFDKAVIYKTWKWIIFAALALALAQLLKFSAFLLFFVFLILILIRAIIDRKDGGFKLNLWRGMKVYFWTCLISVLLVWIVYTPFTWRTPPTIEHQVIENNLTQDPRTLPLRNMLHQFENTPVLRGLGHYFLGVLLVIARVEGGNNTFILGHLSDKAISWYFPVAWLLKTPITIILLALASIFSLIFAWPKEKEKKWQLALILAPIVVYWGFTLKGSLNIGIRHLIPTIPFVLLFIGYFLKTLFASKKRAIYKMVVAALVIYMVISTLANHPNYIAYFNELTPKDQRYTRLIDSSLDWGQDLLRLKKYVDDNQIDDIKVDYFGGSTPDYYIPEAKEWHAEYGPTTGWLAISATFYQSSKLVGPKEGRWSYSWLDQMKPVEQIGGSILIFHILPEDLTENPPVSPYPITHYSFPSN